jgi:hypothetical protein
MLCVWTLSLTCRPCRLWEDLARLECPPWDLVPLVPLVFHPPAKRSLFKAIDSLVRFTLLLNIGRS